MNRTVLLFISLTTLGSCNEKSNGFKDSRQLPSLIYSPKTIRNLEPIALLNLKDGYHLIYTNSQTGIEDRTQLLGQAISKDLVNWTETPKIVFPEMAAAVVRGGIVYDPNNITGLGSRQRPPLVGVFTCSQNRVNVSDKKVLPVIAYSIDGGNTWAVSSNSL